MKCSNHMLEMALIGHKTPDGLLVDCLFVYMQTLELWSLSDDKRIPIQAHEGLIAALAHSPFTGMIASASHDRCVKLWK